jgi:CheY-like chemotaxis protein
MWRDDDNVGYDAMSSRGEKNGTAGNSMHDYQYYDGFDKSMMKGSPNPNMHGPQKGEKDPNEANNKIRREKLERILGSRVNQSVMNQSTMNQSINVDPDQSYFYTEYFDEVVNQSVCIPIKKQENKAIIQTFAEEHKPELSTNMQNTKRRQWLEITDQTEFPEDFTILCVDDNLHQLSNIKNMLKNANVVIDTAVDGMEAFNRVKEQYKIGSKYMIVLMDINMPGYDGYDGARMIRDLEDKNGYDRSFIYCVSADQDDLITSKYKEAKMDMFMEKPISRPNLEKMILERCEVIGFEREKLMFE